VDEMEITVGITKREQKLWRKRARREALSGADLQTRRHRGPRRRHLVELARLADAY
jgi:hypothetical protein